MRALGPYCERRMFVTEHQSASRPRRREYFWIALAALLALFVHFKPAHAGEGVRLELIGGQCKVHPIGTGIWFQREYPHTLELASGCFQISISEILMRRGKWGYGLRLGYVDLGTARMDSEFAVLDQEQHLVPNGADCNQVTFSGCKARGRSAQRTQGFTLGALVERRTGSRTTLGLEGGLFVYSGSFDVTVDVHGMPQDTRWVLHWQGEQISPYFGATLQNGHLFMLARVYTQIRAAEHGCGGCSGFTKGPAGFVGVGAAF